MDLLIYLAKVGLLSALFYGYYLWMLKDKRFHSYNRFYLLSTMLLSILLPLVKLEFWKQSTATNSENITVQILQSVERTDAYFQNVSAQVQHPSFWNVEVLANLLFALISIGFFLYFVTTLVKIYRLKQSNPKESYQGLEIIFTDDKSTPFSFFRNIFWNNKINLHSNNGERILRHELAHINEGHSYDNVFINLVLTVFWSNPIFWLVKQELMMIHEFIADQKAVEDGDLDSFSQMVLQATYPVHYTDFTNPFFYSPIKRRIAMLTNKSKAGYIGRILTLPLLVLAFSLFALKTKKVMAEMNAAHPYGTTTHQGSALQTNLQDTMPSKAKSIELEVEKSIQPNDQFVVKNITNGTYEEFEVNDQLMVTMKRKVIDLSPFNIVDAMKNLKVYYKALYPSTDSIIVLHQRTNSVSVTKQGDKQESKSSVSENVTISVKYDDVEVPAYDENGNFLKTDTMTNEGKETFIIDGKKYKTGDMLGKKINAKSIKVYPANSAFAKKEALHKDGKVYLIEGANISSLVNKNAYEMSAANFDFLNDNGEKKESSTDVPSSNFNKIDLYVIDGKTYNKTDGALVLEKLFKGNTNLRTNVLTAEKAIAKYGEKAKNGAIEFFTKDPVVLLGGKETSRIRLKDFNAEMGFTLDRSNFKIQSGTVYFSGKNFEKIVTKEIIWKNMDQLQPLLKQLVNGSVVTIDNVTVIGQDGQIIHLETRSFAMCE